MIPPLSHASDTAELVKAAEQIYWWVGPGYPDLDDPQDRENFMRDVRKVASAWFSLASRDTRRSTEGDQTP